MSLTTFLANKDIKERLSQEFPKAKFNLKKKILASPITKHYSLVGTAFDYLMRFYLKHINPCAVESSWVAELVVPKVEDNKRLLKKVVNIISEAKTTYSRYLKSGRMDDELIRSAILLAQLDPIFRADIIDENIGIIDDGDTTDLENLISIVRPEFFKAKKLCILNPTFGIASQLVGGADADILIDNTLIDIKTTKDLKLDRKYFNQIIGYYILFKIGGINDVSPKPEIETLGIYYSRYGELYTISVKDVIDDGRLPAFIRWFEKRAADEQSVILQ